MSKFTIIFITDHEGESTPRCDVCNAIGEAVDWCGECGCCVRHCQRHVGCPPWDVARVGDRVAVTTVSGDVLRGPYEGDVNDMIMLRSVEGRLFGAAIPSDQIVSLQVIQ